MFAGTAMMSRCLAGLGLRSSLFRSHASFKWKGKSCPDGDVSSCWLGHGEILVWMANVKTSFLAARIPVWNRSGLTLRSVGSSAILLPVHCVQERCVAFRRVRRVHLLLLRGV